MLRIVPLTQELAVMFDKDARYAMDGDQTCSMQNMNVSCFAAERCIHSHSSNGGGLKSLLAHGYSFVCMDVTCHPPQFVGCVCASLCPRDVANRFQPDKRPDGLVMYSLCVSNRYREQHVGRRLINEVLNVGRKVRLPVFLLVATGHGASSECSLAFESRVPNLREMYTHMGWREQCMCEDYMLFKYCGD